MFSVMHRIATAVLVTLVSLLCGSSAFSQDSIVLRPGIVLDVYAVGVPDFRYRIPINAAGEASFPLMQPMDVDGLSLAEVRERVKATLTTRVYRHRSGDGGEILVNFHADEIVVEVAEYPPIYVTGDVRTPGAVNYRPGLTVRQAIALAGGYDRSGARMGDFGLRAAELRGEAEKLILERAALKGRRDGLQTILDGGTLTGPDSGEQAVRVSRSTAHEIERLKAVEAEITSEQAHIVDAISAEEARLSEISDEYGLVREQLATQERASENVRALVEQQIAPATRLSDELRYLSDVRERALSLSLQQAGSERQIADLVRQRDALAAQHRIDLMAGLQEADLRLKTISAELHSLDERYSFANAGSLASADAVDAVRPHVSLYRREAERDRMISADESSLVDVGDVLEVRVPRRSLTNAGEGY